MVLNNCPDRTIGRKIELCTNEKLALQIFCVIENNVFNCHEWNNILIFFYRFKRDLGNQIGFRTL